MPFKPISEKVLRDIERQFYNMGTAIFQVSPEITKEEEDAYMKNVFYDLRMKGFGHIHTVEVVHDDDDGRESYLIHDTEVDTE